MMELVLFLQQLLHFFIFADMRRCLQKSSLANVVSLKIFFYSSVNLPLNFDLHVVFL